MSLKKQARAFTPTQVKMILGFLATTQSPERNIAIFMLSVKAGLRACEIARLRWEHIINDDEISKHINITDDIAKGNKGGRRFIMNKKLVEALQAYRETQKGHTYKEIVFGNQSGYAMKAEGVVAMFKYWFKKRMKLEGVSSHSGRRTLITNMARNISLCGMSLYDVQKIAGHRNLSSTQYYIEENPEGQEKLMNMI